ncbi:MAG: RNA polymerase factor sigma-54 [Prevotella sp.]|nr:RNA polymerase factor sigma-54 [Prevotella sp.]
MKQIQTQEQKLVQQQKLTQQQMLQIRLLEMPLAELEQNVRTEIDDNPALEIMSPDDQEYGMNNSQDNELSSVDDDMPEDEYEKLAREERESALDDMLSNMGSDDEMPEPVYNRYMSGADYEEITYGDPTSFYDKLKEQMGEENITPHQKDILEYLIGSLDNDGLLRKSLDSISDELAVYHNIEASEEEIEEVLHILQRFDPPGIGGRSLQECLLIQIDRRPPSNIRNLLHSVISECFDSFMNRHWDRIAHQLNIDEDTVKHLQTEILRLNPKPGASMGETEGRNLQQITPDFVVDTDDEGHVSFYINKGRVPDLYVSPTFNDMVKEYQSNKTGMNRQMKEALVYAKEKVDRAKNYIEAVKQRRHTLYITMKTIIDLQLKFFQEGDESDLQPMVLKDVAERTGLDISTVSRVCNVKYAQTRWGTFRLRHFFSEGVKTESGESLSNRKLKIVMQEIIDHEDKRHPLNDDALSKEMKKRGMPIARRTVSKYREQLGIPSARMRKQ